MSLTVRYPQYFRARAFSVLTLLIAAAVTPVRAQKVKVEFDKSVDFSRFKTYRWVDGMAVSNPTMNLYIIAAVDHDIQAKGMKQAEGDKADLWVTYNAASHDDVNVGMIYSPGYVSQSVYHPVVWYVPPTFGSSARYIRKGSFAVELIDPSTKQLVWSGVAEGTVKEQKSKKLDQLDKVVGKMFDQFPPGKAK
jgi:hypothetical protein